MVSKENLPTEKFAKEKPLVRDKLEMLQGGPSRSNADMK